MSKTVTFTGPSAQQQVVDFVQAGLYEGDNGDFVNVWVVQVSGAWKIRVRNGDVTNGWPVPWFELEKDGDPGDVDGAYFGPGTQAATVG